MKLTEWLKSKGKNEQATFIIAKAVKYDNSSIYHNEYRTTPIYCVWEWLKGDTGEKYIVINADHSPIDISGGWTNWYKGGHLQCAIITTEEDLYREMGEEQAKRMLDWYDRETRKQLNNLKTK